MPVSHRSWAPWFAERSQPEGKVRAAVRKAYNDGVRTQRAFAYAVADAMFRCFPSRNIPEAVKERCKEAGSTEMTKQMAGQEYHTTEHYQRGYVPKEMWHAHAFSPIGPTLSPEFMEKLRKACERPEPEEWR